MKYIGLDIHKKETQACVLDEKGKVILIKLVRTDVSDIGHLFGMIEAGNEKLAVVMEATGFYFWIYDLIVARGHDVMVVHPTKAKEMMKSMAKTDKNDAFMLAELLCFDRLKGIYVPSLEIREMRDLTRHRESLARKKGDAKREIIAALDQRGLKVPSEFKTNFTEKYKTWARSLNDFVINEKLDLLELLLTKDPERGEDDRREVWPGPGRPAHADGARHRPGHRRRGQGGDRRHIQVQDGGEPGSLRRSLSDDLPVGRENVGRTDQARERSGQTCPDRGDTVPLRL